MDKTKAKFEFLKTIEPISQSSLLELSKITNSDYAILYNDIVKYNSHSTTDSEELARSKTNIENFIGRAYKNFWKLLKKGSYGKSKVFDDFLTDKEFDPDSEEFKNLGYSFEKLIRSLGQKHPEIKQQFGAYSPIYFQDISFIHVNSNKFYYSKSKKQPNECRLYLNMKVENVAEFATIAMRLGQVLELPLYFKFARNDKRNDTFLFYCSYEEVPKVVALIEQIKAEKPKLFEGTEKVPCHLGKINGYIGFGEEPTEVCKLPIYEDGASYTEVRADMLEELHIVNERFREKKISEEEAKAKRSEITKKYDVARLKLMFLNQSTIDQLSKAGYNIDEIRKNAQNPYQLGE